MGLETATYISDLNPANPVGSDPRSSSDDHLRLIKSAIKATFPNITGAVNPTQSALNQVGVTQSPGDSSNSPASTAFVSAALAAASTNGAMQLRVVTTVTATAAAGEHLVLTNVAQSTATLPASPVAGARVWVTSANGLTTNIVNGNGSLVEDSSTYTITLAAGTSKFRYVNGTVKWIVEGERAPQNGAVLGSTAGAALGIAAAGVATTAARSDHVHAMPTKANIGLGSVDNTSDAAKPVSTAQQAALNGKLDLAGGTLTGALTGTSANFPGGITGPAKETIVVVNSNSTATAGRTYVFNTVVIVLLPATPADGDWVDFINGNFTTCIVGRNGKNIMGLGQDMTVDDAYAAFRLVFSSSLNDWRLK
ncbi:MAG: hypothetical protein RL758_267 [Pseudomonadota bacterium]|jgi:hypothetical protein